MLTDVHRRGIDSATRFGQPGARRHARITLSIDERLQFVARSSELAEAVQAGTLGTVSGSAVVMNPYNGEILRHGQLSRASTPTLPPLANRAPRDGTA